MIWREGERQRQRQKEKEKEKEKDEEKERERRIETWRNSQAMQITWAVQWH